MERRGRINEYRADNRKNIYTINLANGVTAMVATVGSVDYASTWYMLTDTPIVTHAWYRPDLLEFTHATRMTQEHVLNGGLLLETLIEAGKRQLGQDPVEHEWDFEALQVWNKKFYRQRLPAKS